MKREKIIFAFFVIPVFLFSASLRNWKLDRGKNKIFVLSPQQIISLKKAQPLHSEGNNVGLDQVSPKIKPDFPGQAKETSDEVYRSRETDIFTPGENRDFRSKRYERPDRRVIRHQIKHLNQNLPFRYEGPPYRPDEVLVKFKPTLTEQTIKATIAAYQCKKLKRIPRINVYKIQIQNNLSVEETLFAFKRNPDVEYAEPNYIAYVTETPNDPLFDLQYALYNPDSGPPGSPQGDERADIKATSAWEETKGDEDIVIAILDTGVDLNHPDLDDKIYSSGFDFINVDSDATDDEGHGTHVAGIAAAETDNGEGIAGVAWNCKILPVKVLDNLGFGSYSEIIDGIIWAADNGADVINLSLGGDFPSTSLENALKYAYDMDIVNVAAVGNDGGAVLYPAAYDAYCLAVAATNQNDERVDFSNSAGLYESNFGPEIDVAAPGYEIVSTVPTWYFGPGFIPYGIGSGTSQASPHVAGLAALIKSIKPHLTADQIMEVIRFSADDVNFVNNLGKDNYIGYGRINMDKALVPIVIKPSR
ncbi:MAG: S8 family serine peptidase [Candidatus Aminicenantes bacterium]|nr:S8 family serine peptidase [Candidatus Aminicenantes bacterium]